MKKNVKNTITTTDTDGIMFNIVDRYISHMPTSTERIRNALKNETDMLKDIETIYFASSIKNYACRKLDYDGDNF